MDLVRGKKLSSFMSVALLASWSGAQASSRISAVVEKVSHGLVHGIRHFIGGCQRTIQVVGDIEGVWARFESIANNPYSILGIDENGKLFLLEDGELVILGDITDKGLDNEKVIARLLELKEDARYGDRVIFIAGNRDINKLRFLLELPSLDLLDNIESLNLDEATEKEGIYRDDRFRIIEWKEKFDAWRADVKKCVVNGEFVQYTHGNNPEIDKILKMKFLLDQTLGSPTLFEDVKKEKGFTTDAQVYNELINWSQKDGYWGRYLQHAHIAYLDLNAQALHVHGGLSEDNFGRIPGQEGRFEDVAEWVAALNKWFQEGVKDAFKGKYTAAIKALVESQEPPFTARDANGRGIKADTSIPNPDSIIHGRPWSDTYNLSALGSDLAKQLKKEGKTEEEIVAQLKEQGVRDVAAILKAQNIMFVFAGHSPVGDIAVFLRAWNNVITVHADTSASRTKRNSVIKLEKGLLTIRSKYTEDGKEYNILASSEDAEIGTQDELGRWKIGRIVENNKILYGHWAPLKSGPKGFGVPTYKMAEDDTQNIPLLKQQ